MTEWSFRGTFLERPLETAMPLSSRTVSVLFALNAASSPGAVPAQEMAGDPSAGEALFADKCDGCQVVENEAGEILAGGISRQGPNLYVSLGACPAVSHRRNTVLTWSPMVNPGPCGTRQTSWPLCRTLQRSCARPREPGRAPCLLVACPLA